METNGVNTSTEKVESEVVANNTTETSGEKNEKGLIAYLAKFFDGGNKEQEKDGDKADKDDDKKKELKDNPKSDEDKFSELLAKERVKWEEEQKKKAQFEKLPDEEKAKIKEKEKEDKIKDLESKLLKKELKDKALSALSDDGYPVKLAEIITYDSEEGMTKSLEMVKEVFKESLAQAINEKLKGKTPEGLGRAGVSENAIRDEISKAVRGGM